MKQKMFSDHDETSPSIAAVSIVACVIFILEGNYRCSGMFIGNGKL